MDSKIRISEELRDSLIAAVLEAGRKLMGRWPGGQGTASALRIETKKDGSQVTLADHESNAVIVAAIEQLFPNDQLLSEEIEPDAAALAESARVWIIDPLDGTKSFIEGRDDFSVLVALAESFRPTFGIMLFPARNLLVVAEKGGRALSDGAPLQVSTSAEVRNRHVYIRNFVCKRSEVSSDSMDSGLAFLKVASGELDGAIIRMTTHRDWDIAAPIAVIEAAGGRVTDELGKPVLVGSARLTANFVVASNGRVHSELLSLAHS